MSKAAPTPTRITSTIQRTRAELARNQRTARRLCTLDATPSARLTAACCTSAPGRDVRPPGPGAGAGGRRGCPSGPGGRVAGWGGSTPPVSTTRRDRGNRGEPTPRAARAARAAHPARGAGWPAPPSAAPPDPAGGGVGPRRGPRRRRGRGVGDPCAVRHHLAGHRDSAHPPARHRLGRADLPARRAAAVPHRRGHHPGPQPVGLRVRPPGRQRQRREERGRDRLRVVRGRRPSEHPPVGRLAEHRQRGRADPGRLHRRPGREPGARRRRRVRRAVRSPAPRRRHHHRRRRAPGQHRDPGPPARRRPPSR